LRTGLATLYVRGVPIDWPAVFADAAARPVDLPTYAFDHHHYWLSAPKPHTNATDVDAGLWEVVEREDLPALAATLDVDVEQPFSAVLPALSSWRRQRRKLSVVDGWRYRATWKRTAD